MYRDGFGFSVDALGDLTSDLIFEMRDLFEVRWLGVTSLIGAPPSTARSRVRHETRLGGHDSHPYRPCDPPTLSFFMSTLEFSESTEESEAIRVSLSFSSLYERIGAPSTTK